MWTRVMGYHRPVASFNIGKKGEHAERVHFREECRDRRDERRATSRSRGSSPSRLSTGRGSWPRVLFLQGCPWNCGYCQNPDLIDAMVSRGSSPGSRCAPPSSRGWGCSDGVVFSGGEPTRQAGDRRGRRRGQGTWDSGPSFTRSGRTRLASRSCFPTSRWVGLDIKAPLSRYPAVTGARAGGERAWASLDLLVASGVDYEVRITVDPTVLSLADIEEIVAELEHRGARSPVLQEARSDGVRPEYAERLGKLRLSDVVPYRRPSRA